MFSLMERNTLLPHPFRVGDGQNPSVPGAEAARLYPFALLGQIRFQKCFIAIRPHKHHQIRCNEHFLFDIPSEVI
jgi:hypothetical protein